MDSKLQLPRMLSVKQVKEFYITDISYKKLLSFLLSHVSYKKIGNTYYFSKKQLDQISEAENSMEFQLSDY